MADTHTTRISGVLGSQRAPSYLRGGCLMPSTRGAETVMEAQVTLDSRERD